MKTILKRHTHMNNLNPVLFALLLLSSTLSAQSPCLVASYPFNGNANDESGNGHDGTVHGAVLATDRFGVPNSCYQFDGVNDDIQLAGSFNSNEGTVTAWINMSDMSLLNTVFSGRDSTTNGVGIELDVDPYSTVYANQLSYGLDRRDCVGGNNLFFVFGEPELSPNTWHQVAMSSDGSVVTLYIDCQPVSTYGNDGGGLWFNDLCQNITWMIGRNKRPLSESLFRGRIDDLQIFNCALTASQMDSLCQLDAQVFTDQIAGSGLNPAQGYPVAMYDHDRDGFIDLLYASGNPRTVQLMRNNGDLTFTDISTSSNFTSEASGAISTLDLDNNGWVDLIYTNDVTNTLTLELNHNGIFTTDTVHLPVDIISTPVFMDYDGDGAIDLIFPVNDDTGGRSVRVVYNDVCTAQLPDVLQNSATLISGFPANVSPYPYVFDYDNDQDMDILLMRYGAISNSQYSYQPMSMFRNDAGVFTDVTASTGIGLGNAGTLWDYNNDGFLDITFGTLDCCDQPNVARTYRNNGDGTFTDVSSSVVLKNGNNYFFSMWPADQDNDGDEDAYWYQGAWTVNQFFRNDGGVFNGNIAADIGLDLSGGHDNNGALQGVAPYWFDADNDGDLDVLCGANNLDGLAKLMINPLASGAGQNGSLEIDLEGCASGRSATNASVRVYHNDQVATRVKLGYEGEMLSRLHFGTGAAQYVDSVVVLWPSGAIKREYEVPTNQLLTIQEAPDCIFTDCLTTAIGASTGQNSLLAYPNPTKGTIRIPDLPPSVTPQLFDATGRALEITAQRQGRDVILDLGTFPTGLYLIRIADRSFIVVHE